MWIGMKTLTYSDYINDVAIIEAARVPPVPPAGQSGTTWPIWHLPGAPGEGVAWSPGQPWPREDNWSHDEVLFIRAHQAFEVWFALILHELDDVMFRAAQLIRARGARLNPVELAGRRSDAAPHQAAEFPAIS